jgi:type IV pilus assembly protein PilA
MIATKKLRTVIFSGVLLFTLSASLAAGAQAVPQTARQALLEMFFSKTPGTLEKHLPQATRAALRKAGTASDTSFLGGFSAITGQLTAHGQQLQTFEAGPVLMSIEDPQTHTKFEITVEGDDLQGDEDAIELSFHGYKDGETQTAGTKTRFTLTMKQEAGSWRLNEVMVSVGVSLTDPEFLKAMTTGIKATSTASTQISMSAPTAVAVTNAGNEASAASALRTLNIAEVSYAAAFPAQGFTCTLADLGGMGGGGGPNEHQAMLIDPRLSSGRKNGYVFKLSGCDGSPATRYSVTAVPADPASGTRAFCSDESAVIRVSPDGKAESCLSVGKPLQ